MLDDLRAHHNIKRGLIQVFEEMLVRGKDFVSALGMGFSSPLDSIFAQIDANYFATALQKIGAGCGIAAADVKNARFGGECAGQFKKPWDQVSCGVPFFGIPVTPLDVFSQMLLPRRPSEVLTQGD